MLLNEEQKTKDNIINLKKQEREKTLTGIVNKLFKRKPPSDEHPTEGEPVPAQGNNPINIPTNDKLKFKNSQDDNLTNDKNSMKRDRHRKIINNKKMDYQLSLDKKYLSDEKKLMKIDKDNKFTVNEAKIKNNQDILILKAGKKIAKMCLILTFISCLMTIGGNIDTFICNIPLIKGESAKEFLLTWRKVVDTKVLSDGVEQDVVKVLRFNFVTTMIYIPFIIALQTILYQVSINLYNIKTKFARYYLHAILLQYSMLIYSVYSNYKFLAYYTNPKGIGEMFVTFIPALLLDIGCIFFLSLSQDKKSLNYHHEKIDNLFKSIKNLFKKKDEKITITNPENSQKDNLKKDEISTFETSKKGLKSPGKDNLILDENTNLKNENFQLESKPKRYLKNEKNENSESLEAEENDNKKKDEKKDVITDEKKVENSKKNRPNLRRKKVTKNVSNKVKNADVKRVENYLNKVRKTGEKKVIISDLISKCKVDKNRWQEIRKDLIEKGMLYMSENKRTTFINLDYQWEE